MQLLGLRITRAASAIDAERRSTLAAPMQWLLDAIRDITGGTDAKVNDKTALSLAAVQACIRVISESVATMPLRFYRDDFGVKTSDNAHPLAYLINEPNPIQTRFEFISWCIAQLKMGGNGYCRIHRDPQTFRPVMLEPIQHSRVTPKLSNSFQVFYKVEGIEEPIPATDMLHFKGLSSGDPLTGISPIRAHAESLGVTLGAQRSSAKFYNKGASLKWGVKYQGAPLTQEQAKTIKSTFNDVLQGQDTTVFIPNGTDLQQLTLTPQEAEYIQTRRYGVEDIARIFGVPAYMIGADTQGIKSSVEQQAQDFYTQTILPIVTMMEQEMKRKLLREDEKGVYYFKFVFNSLLRADAKSRGEFYNLGIRGGWLSPNEARALEDFNAQTGGDTTFTESNLVPSDMMRPWIQSKIDAAPQAQAQNNNPDGEN